MRGRIEEAQRLELVVLMGGEPGLFPQTSVNAVLASYDTTQHPIFPTLLESGLLGLAREAEALGYVLKTDYSDRCHLCQEAREVSLSKYLAYLVPEQHYR